ncbi:CDT1-like protein a, chloroplastic [Rhododendron vialii]|uniref:CDT1-like protein a, chloroplastic n=1 Tax=Rhododendron vialii TaxID=182163 RepID=UPI00265E1FEC|nr:CDT1-like protein a, chloroplastic [Rhododendron vialii]
MEASPDSKPFDSFKSKKILHSSSSQKPSPSEEITTKPVASNRSPWSAQTPEKPAGHPRRARNRRAAFSVKEVREEASKLNAPEQGRIRLSDPVGSSGQQIGSGSGKPKKKVDGPVKLPEKYEILGRFFDSLDSSIRLLRLKGSMSTFTNISPKVEFLTDRRFSYAHLAQLKFILPEVIEMKKVLVHDERTSCMKPDLHIAMNVDAIKNEGKLKSASGNSYMRKIFHSRLLDFFKAHPEGEVPEENLPEPFNKSKLVMHTGTSNASIPSLIGEASTGVLPEQQPAAATHLSHTFRKHFSQKVSRYATENSDQEKGTVAPQPSALPVSKLDVDQSSNEGRISASSAPSISKFSLKPSTSDKCSSLGASQASVPLSHPHTTPLKKRDLDNEASSVGTATIQGTPAKLVSTPVKLMSATPALRPPKRIYMSPDDYTTTSQNKLIRRPLRNRSLKFDSPVKNAEVKDEVNHVGGLSVDEVFDILPENLLKSIKEKERKALEEKDPAISQAKRRQKMIASLPKLFDMIRFLFQSIKRSVVTKEEFMHQIVANHLDIVDRREVEEQLKLLQELAPEWIYEKLASSGDLLICINKMFSPDSMRARLVEAK